MVLFPNVVIPITVSREKSIQALNEAEKNGKNIGVVSQLDSKSENPSFNDINKVGTVAQIIKQIKMPDNSITVFIRGRLRFKVNEWLQDDPCFKANVTYLDDVMPAMDDEYNAMISSVKEMAEQIMRKSNNVPPEAAIVLKNIENISFLNHFIASNLNCETKDKQTLLEENDFKLRTENLLRLLQVELQHVELKNKITNKTDIIYIKITAGIRWIFYHILFIFRNFHHFFKNFSGFFVFQ
jgi:ATP-dependent Lon protease